MLRQPKSNHWISPMPKKPNRIHESYIDKYHDTPLLGALIVKTDKGVMDFAINRAAAEILRDALNDFLATT